MWSKVSSLLLRDTSFCHFWLLLSFCSILLHQFSASSHNFRVLTFGGFWKNSLDWCSNCLLSCQNGPPLPCLHPSLIGDGVFCWENPSLSSDCSHFMIGCSAAGATFSSCISWRTRHLKILAFTWRATWPESADWDILWKFNFFLYNLWPCSDSRKVCLSSTSCWVALSELG